MNSEGRAESPKNEQRTFFLLALTLTVLAAMTGGLGVNYGRAGRFGGIESHFILSFLPLVMLLIFFGTSLLIERKDWHAQRLVVWLLCFLYGLQLLLTLVTFEILSNTIRGIPVVAGLMFLVLGRLVLDTPFESVMGLRTTRSRSHPSEWRRVHRRFGYALSFAALIVLILTIASLEPGAIVLICIGPPTALIFALLPSSS
ncbi:MAG: hypothetical protein VYC39_05825 [Myxococcota bacterium]|nr:hypothetical protein [Myxococcota bacterium]